MRNILLILISCLALLSCDKNDDDNSQDPISQLPPATMTGENTFGFLLNGEPINVTNTTQQFAIYQGGFLQFGAEPEFNNTEIRIKFILLNPLGENIQYDLTDFSNYRSRIQIISSSNCFYDYEETITGNVFFSKIDSTNFIISGKFEFTTSTDGCEQVQITDGRFDLQYIP